MRKTYLCRKARFNAADEYSPAIIRSGTRLELTYDVKLDLDFGQYTFDFGVAEIEEAAFQGRHELSVAQVAAHVTMLCSVHGAGAISVVNPPMKRYATYSHLGVADLPNEFRTVITQADLAEERRNIQ